MRTFVKARTGDLLFLGCIGILIGAYSFFVSHDRILWSDELFAWSLVTDPHWLHMWKAWNLGADSGGIAFYVLCRPWLGLFGKTAIAYRAFSAAGVFAAFAAMWFLLRRYYRPWIAGVALFTVFFGSPTILWQVVQTRFYGLLLGAAAWSVYAMVRSAEEADAGRAQRLPTLLLTFAANLLLAGAHPLGLLYSGLLVGAALLDDLLARRRRALFYAAAVLPWPLVLGISRTAMRNLARVSQPWFWTTRPQAAELMEAYSPSSLIGHRHRFLLFFAVLGVALVIGKLRWRTVRSGWKQRKGLLLCAVLLLLAPVLLWLLSQGATSYFVDRYYLPYTLGTAILLAELLHLFFADWQRRKREVALLLGALTVVAVLVVVHKVLLDYPNHILYPPKDFTADLAAMLPLGEPVVIPKTDIFDEMAVYQTARGHQFLFPYDWELAIDPRSPKWLVSAEREMDNADRAGYYPGQVMPSDRLLKTQPRFAVVTDGRMPWFQERILGKPTWRVLKLGEYRNGFWSNTIWQVDRVQP